MKILIVEDEKSAAKRLMSLLDEVDPDFEVLQVIDSVKGAVGWFKANKLPDLLFLDIQLADGLSFEIFDQIEVSCPVIFTTAYDQYALKAFEVNSIDYLLKPIEKAKLAKAVNKFKQITEPVHPFTDPSVYHQVLQMIQGKSYKERFIVKFGEHIKSISVEQICCFFSEEKITFFKTYEGKKYVIDYTLEQVEALVDPARFFRINRKYIVHVEGINDVVIYSNSRLKLIMDPFRDMDLIVARERVQDFKAWLDR
jgi:DNA-binding LytR/AlgR family response regulator